MPDDSASFTQPGPTDTPVFTQPPDPRARLEELLTSEFVTKAHIDPVQAQVQAKWLVDSTAISAHIASHATPPPNLSMSPQEARLEAFKNLLVERAFEESFAEMPTPAAKSAAHEILVAENSYDYRSLYQAAQDVPLPPLSEGNQLHPFVSYIFETGSSKFKHEAGSLALKKFANTEPGKKVIDAALNNRVTKEAAKKLLTQLGVKVAAQTATAGGGAAAGAEAGAAAGAPGGPLAIITAIVGAVAGFVVGIVVGNWSKAKHEAQEGILALSAAVYTIGSSIFSGGVAAIGAIFAAIGSVAVASAGTIIVIVLVIPIVLAFFLYIINNSAYVVPPGASLTGFGSAVGGGSGPPYTGPLPEGCPDGWPVTGSYRINQGSWVAAKYPSYHHTQEALDIGTPMGTPVISTHPGVAYAKVGSGANAGYGNYVDIMSTCTLGGNAIEMFSRYAHLQFAFVSSGGTPVTKGQQIGLSGGSGGYAAAPHLHYEFRLGNGLNGHYETNTPPYMWPNFIPKAITRGCYTYDDPSVTYVNSSGQTVTVPIPVSDRCRISIP